MDTAKTINKDNASMGASTATTGSLIRTAAACAVAAAGFAALAAQPAASQTRAELQGALADEQELPQTLAGCSLPLPGGRDRDSGLSEQYISDRQGQPYLFAPSLTARQTYTDNVTLAPEGEEESDHITQIIPALSFCHAGPRMRTQVDYQAQLLHYWEDSDRNDVFHSANVNNTTTLVQDVLFLDLGGRFDQQPRTISGAFTEDNELVTGNRQDTTSLRASPYAFQSLGPLGDSVTRYEYRRRMYDDTPDTTRHIGSFNVTSPGAADPLSWQGNVRTERVTRDDLDDPTYFDDAFIELGYRAIGRLTLLGRGGLETVNRADGTRDRFGNEYWEAGFRWSDARTSVEARFGERFFGETYFAAISRRSGRFTASLDYRETQEIPERVGTDVPEYIQELEEFGLIDVPEPELTITKRLTASGTYETGLSTFRVTAFDDRRELVISEEERRRYGVNASWQWRFAPRTTLTHRFTWERIDNRDGEVDTLRGARLSIARMLDRNTQAGATIRRQDRISDTADREYIETAITLELTRLF